MRLKTLLSLIFVVTFSQIISHDVFAFGLFESSSKESTLSKNEYIMSKGKIKCKSRTVVNTNSRNVKKVKICPINSNNFNLFNLRNIKNIAINYYKIRNIIYIVCFLVLCFIWARARYRGFIEWNMFFSVILLLVFATIINLMVNWYILYSDIYLYHCKNDNMLWIPCTKGKGAVSVYKKDIIMFDRNGNILNNRFMVDRFKNNYKVNMFY